MFSGAVHDTGGSAHVALKDLIQEKKSLHIISMFSRAACARDRQECPYPIDCYLTNCYIPCLRV